MRRATTRPDPNATAIQQLCGAARAGDVDEVQRLLDAGTPVDGENPGGWTALQLAIKANQSEVVRALLQAGAAPSELASCLDALDPDLDILTLLLQAGADPNQDGVAVSCAFKDATDIVRLLRAHGLRPDGAGIAAWCGHPETCRLLLPGDPGPAWAPFLAVLEHDDAALQAHLQAGRARETDPHSRVTLLDWAIGVGTDEAVRMLAGVSDLKDRRVNGCGAVTHAIAVERPVALRAILAAGGDPNDKQFLRSPVPSLVLAVDARSLDLLEALVDAGARLDAAAGSAALNRAMTSGEVDLALYLLRNGVSVNQQGWAHLHTAVETGTLELVQGALDAGAKPRRKCDGVTAADLAGQLGLADVEALIRSRGG